MIMAIICIFFGILWLSLIIGERVCPFIKYHGLLDFSVAIGIITMTITALFIKA